MLRSAIQKVSALCVRQSEPPSSTSSRNTLWDPRPIPVSDGDDIITTLVALELLTWLVACKCRYVFSFDLGDIHPSVSLLRWYCTASLLPLGSLVNILLKKRKGTLTAEDAYINIVLYTVTSTTTATGLHLAFGGWEDSAYVICWAAVPIVLMITSGVPTRIYAPITSLVIFLLFVDMLVEFHVVTPLPTTLIGPLNTCVNYLYRALRVWEPENPVCCRNELHSILSLTNVFAPMSFILWILTRFTTQRRISQEGSDALLCNLVPRPIARKLRCGASPQQIVQYHSEVTCLFTDIANFTKLCDNPGMEPHAIFTILNELYSMFDVMAVALDVYKVETIGDSYFAVGGLFNRQSVESCFRVGVFALAAQEFVRGEFGKRTGIQIRVGLHTGDVATGVLGYSRPRFVIIGDTVNTASRMESTSSIDTVQVTHTTEKLLSRFFKLTERSEVAVKGKGTMRTYTLCELREDVPRDFRPGCLQLSPQDLVILARKYVLDQTNMARSNMSEIQHTHTKYETAPTSGLMNLVNLQYDARLSPSHHRRGSHNWTGVDMGRLRSMSDDLLRLRSPESSSSIACMFKSCDESDLTSVTEGRLRCHSMP